MISIKIIYELYHQPVTDFPEDYKNTKRNQGIGRVAFNTTCCFYSVEKFGTLTIFVVKLNYARNRLLSSPAIAS
jgi:hypothetical protein